MILYLSRRCLCLLDSLRAAGRRIWSVGSVGRARRSHRRGHWFESSTDHQPARSGGYFCVHAHNVMEKGVKTMARFIPYQKLPKKKQQELDRQRRGSWNGVNPVTRKPENSKVYHRNKAQSWKKDTGDALLLYPSLKIRRNGRILAIPFTVFTLQPLRSVSPCKGKHQPVLRILSLPAHMKRLEVAGARYIAVL